MDTFLQESALLNKLKEQYNIHKKIIVAYDYDDTIAPTYSSTCCDDVIALIKELKPYAVFICYTANRNTEVVKNYIKEHDIPCDAFNDNVDFMMDTFGDVRKIYFNILLDDKTGLIQTYNTLKDFLAWVKTI